MARNTVTKTGVNTNHAAKEAARAAWLEEENDAYHAQFDMNDSIEANDKFSLSCSRFTDEDFGRDLGISVADW